MSFRQAVIGIYFLFGVVSFVGWLIFTDVHRAELPHPSEEDVNYSWAIDIDVIVVSEEDLSMDPIVDAVSSVLAKSNLASLRFTPKVFGHVVPRDWAPCGVEAEDDSGVTGRLAEADDWYARRLQCLRYGPVAVDAFDDEVSAVLRQSGRYGIIINGNVGDHTVYVGTHRHVWTSLSEAACTSLDRPAPGGTPVACQVEDAAKRAAETLSAVVSSNARAFDASSHTTVALRSASHFAFSFSLINEDSSESWLSWNFEETVLPHVAPLLSIISSVAALSFDSQELHFAPAAARPTFDETRQQYCYQDDDLGVFVEPSWALESVMAPGESAVAHFVAVVTDAYTSPVCLLAPLDAQTGYSGAGQDLKGGDGGPSDIRGGDVHDMGSDGIVGVSGVYGDEASGEGSDKASDGGSDETSEGGDLGSFGGSGSSGSSGSFDGSSRYGSSGGTSDDNLVAFSFVLPQWGGVAVLNHPGCREAHSSSDSTGQDPAHEPGRANAAQDAYGSHTGERFLTRSEGAVLGSFLISQIRTLLGLPSQSLLTGSDVGLGHAVVQLWDSPLGISGWEVDSLYRHRAVDNARVAYSNLSTMKGVIEKLPAVAIPDRIASNFVEALSLLEGSIEAAHNPESLPTCTSLTFEALRLSDVAFYDPSVMAQLYFPEEFKAAVYTPFFLPMTLPVFTRILSEVKRWKALRHSSN
eukprot:Rmarinus@m.11656